MLFIVACSKEQPDVARLFYAMNTDVKYTETSFSGDDAIAIADLVKNECQGLGDSFTRVTMNAKTSSLVLYLDDDGNVACSALKPKQNTSIEVKSRADAPDATVAVVVNEKTITITQIQEALARVSAQPDAATVNAVVNQLIDVELLRQQAEKYDVTDIELATERKQFFERTGLSEEQVAENLKATGSSEEKFREELVQQLKVQKLFKERLLSDEVQVSDDDVKNYYLDNANQFLVSEQALMRQIFVADPENGRAKAQQAADLLQSKDFCEVVLMLSEDTQTKDKCGAYLVARGVLPKNLEDAAFGTPMNQTAVVFTESGIHLVQTLQVTMPRVQSYAEVAQSLKASLQASALQQRYTLYLVVLRSDAMIVSYLG